MGSIAEFIDDLLRGVPDFTLMEESFEQLFERLQQVTRQNYLEAHGEAIDLQPGSPETLQNRKLAAELYHLQFLQELYFKQNMIKCSFGAALDNLVANKAIYREGAKSASCTLRFHASDLMTRAISVFPGTRVRTEDDIAFRTEQYAEIPPGRPWVDVRAIALEEGLRANGVPPGEVCLFIDKPAYVKKVENLDTTGGGDDVESDERLKLRFLYEWTRHNTCGSREAYEYFVRSFQNDIGTVKALGPNDGVGVEPGHVLILFLMDDGRVPEDILLKRVREKLMSEAIHTMGDFVTVAAPKEIAYSIELSYTVLTRDANYLGEIQQKVNEAVQEYIRKQQTIGACINPDNLIELVKGAGAHRCPIVQPIHTEIPRDGVAKLVGEPVITYVGLEAG